MSGIWKYNSKFKYQIEPKDQISFGEGDTSLKKFIFNSKEFYIKNEFENPSGSFKDRSMAYVLSYYLSKNINKFAFSSSGNFAISFLTYTKNIDVEANIFILKNISKEKLKRILNVINKKNYNSELNLKYKNINIDFVEKPKFELFKFLKNNPSFQNLLGSRNEFSIEGYKTIGLELQNQLPETDAIFIPTSSGTGAIGIYNSYVHQKKIPQFHLIQSTKIHPLSKLFDKNFSKSDKCLATAISDRVCLKKEKLIELINISKGFAWTISNDELIKAKIELKAIDKNIKFSYDSLLAFAGFIKAVEKFKFNKPVLLFTG